MLSKRDIDSLAILVATCKYHCGKRVHTDDLEWMLSDYISLCNTKAGKILNRQEFRLLVAKKKLILMKEGDHA